MDLFNNKWITAGFCGYEVTAIIAKHLTKKDTIPTITTLSARHRWIGVALMAALGWHFATVTP
jgi:hypothetical protein